LTVTRRTTGGNIPCIDSCPWEDGRLRAQSAASSSSVLCRNAVDALVAVGWTVRRTYMIVDMHDDDVSSGEVFFGRDGDSIQLWCESASSLKLYLDHKT
jgi:hypothetical protein